MHILMHILNLSRFPPLVFDLDEILKPRFESEYLFYTITLK